MERTQKSERIITSNIIVDLGRHDDDLIIQESPLAMLTRVSGGEIRPVVLAVLETLLVKHPEATADVIKLLASHFFLNSSHKKLRIDLFMLTAAFNEYTGLVQLRDEGKLSDLQVTLMCLLSPSQRLVFVRQFTQE